jgi:hypothetical protein
LGSLMVTSRRRTSSPSSSASTAMWRNCAARERRLTT